MLGIRGGERAQLLEDFRTIRATIIEERTQRMRWRQETGAVLAAARGRG